MSKSKKIKNNFYETKDFEVFCFCLLKNKNTEDLNINNINDFILVGGYDNQNNQGLIKIYEIIYDDKIENIKLEFKKNIIDSHLKFPINCIIQSSKTEEILVTCWDGTVNLFTAPILSELL